MFFTQEDYRKIERWLLANSRKDTDFVGAATPLKGNETVVLVQDGKNVKTSVKDIVDQFFLLGVSDFLNITDKYGESYISLTQAIQLIPFRSRKEGQVITFIDESGNWAIYQFQGKALNQWNNTTLWIDLLAKISGIPIIDSEDITTKENGAKQVSLYLADKQYNEADYSGLGRIYLRKNIQNIIDPSTGKVINVNLLTQSMLAKENTTYIIQYDYNLNKQTISIPEGSVLLFEGGSIDDGVINCNGTTIVDKFSGNATIVGTYSFQDAQADEEDITQNQSSVLKFKDRKYEPDKYSGLGRVILRKNIVEIEDPIYGKVTKNILSQDMIAQANTVYEIRYDFDLNGAEITIPEGCVLDFQGGSIKNGMLNLSNTMLTGLVDIDARISGVIKNDTVYTKWFNLYGDGVTDDSRRLVDIVNALKKSDVTLVFEHKVYLMGDGLKGENGTGNSYIPDAENPERPSNSNDVNLGRDIRLKFVNKKNIIINGNDCTLASNVDNGECRNTTLLWIENCDNITINDITVDGKKNERHPIFNDYNIGRGHADRHNIAIFSCENVYLKNVKSINSIGNGFDLKYGYPSYESQRNNRNIVFDNCVSDNSYKNGIGSNSCVGLRIIGGEYARSGKTYGIFPMAAMDFEADGVSGLCSKITIDGVKVEDTVGKGIVLNDGVYNATVMNCEFVNSSLYLIYKKSVTSDRLPSENVLVTSCLFQCSFLFAYGYQQTVMNCNFKNDLEGGRVSPFVATNPETVFTGNKLEWDISKVMTDPSTKIATLSGVVTNNIFRGLISNNSDYGYGNSTAVYVSNCNLFELNSLSSFEEGGDKARVYIDSDSVTLGSHNLYSNGINLTKNRTGNTEFGTVQSQTGKLSKWVYLTDTERIILIKTGVDFVATVRYGESTEASDKKFYLKSSKANRNSTNRFEEVYGNTSNVLCSSAKNGVVCIDLRNETVFTNKVFICLEILSNISDGFSKIEISTATELPETISNFDKVVKKGTWSQLNTVPAKRVLQDMETVVCTSEVNATDLEGNVARIKNFTAVFLKSENKYVDVFGRELSV